MWGPFYHRGRTVKCRKCSAEIADKAIVCYRCGTPTEDLPAVSAPPPPSRRSNLKWLLFWVLVVAAALAIYFYAAARQTESTPKVKLDAPRYKLSGYVDAPA
jgi:hypothetical protein